MYQDESSTSKKPYDLKTFQLGDIIVKAATNELIIDRSTIQIEDKVMKVLVYLASHDDRIVSREELFEQLWSDVYVSQDSLNRCISILRKVLNDGSNQPRIIQTIRNRGYRIICSVSGLEGSNPISRNKTMFQSLFEKATYVASGVVITVAAALLVIIVNCFT